MLESVLLNLRVKSTIDLGEPHVGQPNQASVIANPQFIILNWKIFERQAGCLTGGLTGPNQLLRSIEEITFRQSTSSLGHKAF